MPINADRAKPEGTSVRELRLLGRPVDSGERKAGLGENPEPCVMRGWMDEIEAECRKPVVSVFDYE